MRSATEHASPSPVWQPTVLRRFLTEQGIRPHKSLSQNFLIDGNIVAKVVEAAALSSGDTVLEVGPGPGALTQPILESGAKVVAVEKDRVLAEALSRFQTTDNQLIIHIQDILKFPLDSLPKGTLVIANPPYKLTTPLLARLLQEPGRISKCFLVLQEEFADRLVAAPRSKRYSSISVFTQLQCEVKKLFRISRRCFSPVPNVDSALVSLDLGKGRESNPALFAFTHSAFGQRRKMLKNVLKSDFAPSRVEEALSEMGHLPSARPEELSPADFVSLFHRLSSLPPTLASE